MALKNNKFILPLALTLLLGFIAPNIISAQQNTATVFIDVGHGGHDNGSSHNGYIEDKLNLQISNLVAKKLKQNKIDVKLSRKNDKYISLSERTYMANKSGADLFVSIHQNASERTSSNGVETFYMGDNEEFAKLVQENIIENTSAKDRAHKKGNLQVLRDNELPAVLVECGFISNPNEGYKLSTEAYQEKLADGIVDGIMEYLNLDYVDSKNTSSSNTNYKTALNDVTIMSDRDKHSQVIGTLPQGSKVEVIDSKFDWLKIKYDGKIGYVSGVYVK